MRCIGFGEEDAARKGKGKVRDREPGMRAGHSDWAAFLGRELLVQKKVVLVLVIFGRLRLRGMSHTG